MDDASKLYDVIYCDPPWQYGSGGVRSGRYGELDYPTMTLPEMMALPVSSWAAKDAALFMWVTGSFVQEAIALGTAWGFRFIRIDKVWVKETHKGGRHAVVGPWGMSDCEFVFLFVRGKMCRQQAVTNEFVAVREPYPGRHSGKPEFFRDLVRERFGDEIYGHPVRRLEMFAREASDGWDAWGNEAPNCVELTTAANDNEPATASLPAAIALSNTSI